LFFASAIAQCRASSSRCARGLGSALTTLHLLEEKDATKLLGLTDDVTLIARLPVVYPRGPTSSVRRGLPGRRLRTGTREERRRPESGRTSQIESASRAANWRGYQTGSNFCSR